MIDIQAGDVVVCVDDTPHLYSTEVPALHKQRVYRVIALYTRKGNVGLRLAEHGSGVGWRAARFRKVRKATEEFTARIKAIRPIKQREDA